MSFQADVAVVGAGPAGAAAAAALAGAGHRVWLLEAREVPRHKVCGEFLSPDARPSLSALGLIDRVEQASPETILKAGFRFAAGRPIDFSLPAPALGLSRHLFDALLIEAASAAGALFHPVSTVRAIEGDLARGFQISIAGAPAPIRARAVVGAWGRQRPPGGSGADGRNRGPRFFGWKRHWIGASSHLAGSVRLYFFGGGYCGLSRVENGVVNFAGVVREDVFRRCGGQFAPLLDRLIAFHRPLREDLTGLNPEGELAGAGPIRFAVTSSGPRDVLRVGDASGTIDLFTGDGQAQALESGLLAARSLDAFLTGRADAEQTRRGFAASWAQRSRPAMRWASLLRPILLRPWLAGPVCRSARPLIPRFFARTRGPIGSCADGTGSPA